MPDHVHDVTPVPPALLRSGDAAPPRTLVDIVQQTAARLPDAPALDNGATLLTYAEFIEAAGALADELSQAGIGSGDRVGIRIDSGTIDLYLAIVGTLLAGAAYVPVDVDDPDSRARTVFDEADVAAVITNGLVMGLRHDGRAPRETHIVSPDDDAWIIFTSGSTGVPKGVAVSHRSAAAFVDAESTLFLPDQPIGFGDRVMAGLSVAFDASCEEMWLAWRHGACLVPAPRSLVKSGTDLGPWMVANDITVVSTVPTLVSLWPAEALDDVRLLILGGEACPPEIGARLARPGREVWNTYGPTEATVVACAAQLTADSPVRIGLPLQGWDLAVVDPAGSPVAPGEPGELIIGGVGLARYLDPAKDAEKYAPHPGLGWERAYRSGDIVSFDGQGLLFVGRIDEQIKLGGRRVELGEVDSALLSLPGVNAAGAAVRRTRSGNQILVGYLSTDDDFDTATAMALLRERMPASLVPRLALLDSLPTRTSGKIDRDALPWPLPTAGTDREPLQLDGTAAWLQTLWLDVLGAVVTEPSDDFFTLGGGSLTAAQLVGRLRERFPEATVADVYDHPTLAGLAAALDDMQAASVRHNESVRPVFGRTQVAQVLLTVPLRAISGLRWVTWTAIASHPVAWLLDWAWLPQLSWWWIVPAWLLLLTPPGRMLLSAAAARCLLRSVTPGTYARGGKVHLRLWLAERVADELQAASLSGAGFFVPYARLLGARIGPDVDLHSMPPVTGMLAIGRGSSIEPEVDLSGHWLDGDVLHIGRVVLGEDTRIGVRSMIAGGVSVGDRAEVGAGASVLRDIPAEQYWSGAPARTAGPARGPLESYRPERHVRWLLAYTGTAMLIAMLPLLAIVAGAASAWWTVGPVDSLGSATIALLIGTPVATVVGLATLAALIIVLVRLLSLGLNSGTHPVHGLRAWQAWSTFRVLDEARTWLFPLYSSTLTPVWLRALGAKIGTDVEASTVLMLPALTSVNDGAFLADDTMLGMYELGGGWLRIEQVKIGRHAFVGNSGMTAPGRKVPKRGLVAVLSAAPRRAKAKAGTSWLGSPPKKLRRVPDDVDVSRTFEPPTPLRIARALIEACRILAAMMVVALALVCIAALVLVADRVGWLASAVVAGPVLIVAGVAAAGVTSMAKWALVGRVRATDHPLWSSFVWRSELSDTFVEVLGAPWFAQHVTGTPLLNLWLRSLGAQIGRGVWCETYWLPEADLVTVEAGATVNRGCVVQTHLFHGRILSMDTVTLRAGATLGPHSVILPAATLGRHATIGPGSLVMRGESVPDKTRWVGNPIGPWTDDDSATDAA